MENAKIYAENVIRNKKEALNLKRFSVKMGALASKIESAARTQQVSLTRFISPLDIRNYQQ